MDIEQKEKPSIGSTALVAVMSIVIVLLIAVIAFLLVAKNQDTQNANPNARTDEPQEEVEEDEVVEDGNDVGPGQDEDADVPGLSQTTNGNWRYENEHYGFSILFDKNLELCLNDFCDNAAEGEDIQYVKVSDPNDYGVGYAFYLEVTELDGRDVTEVGEGAKECVEDSRTGEVVSVRDDGETVVGVEGYEFMVANSFCDGGRAFAIENTDQARVSYFEYNDHLFRMIVPDEIVFNRIMDTFSFID